MTSSRFPARSGPMARTLGGSASGSRSTTVIALLRACRMAASLMPCCGLCDRFPHLNIVIRNVWGWKTPVANYHNRARSTHRARKCRFRVVGEVCVLGRGLVIGVAWQESAVCHRGEGSADLLAGKRQRPNPVGEEGPADGLEVVERCRARHVDTVFLIERYLRGDPPNSSADWCHQDPVEHGDRLGASHDQDGPAFVLCFCPPDVPLARCYHASSAIISTVARSAQATSS